MSVIKIQLVVISMRTVKILPEISLVSVNLGSKDVETRAPVCIRKLRLLSAIRIRIFMRSIKIY